MLVYKDWPILLSILKILKSKKTRNIAQSYDNLLKFSISLRANSSNDHLIFNLIFKIPIDNILQIAKLEYYSNINVERSHEKIKSKK